jgi:hypothetical protein
MVNDYPETKKMIDLQPSKPQRSAEPVKEFDLVESLAKYIDDG